MPGSLVFSTQLAVTWLLVFARVAGVVTLAPLPGSRLFPASARAALALLLTAVLAPMAMAPYPGAGAWTVGVWMIREAGFGLAVGVAMQFLLEMMGLAAQMLGFQAGYSYINTVDPASQVDATILNVLITMLGGLLFFSLDLHLHLVRALARSLELVPLGQFSLAPQAGIRVAQLGGAALETAVRLAYPVVAVLVLLDLALSLLSYVNARMQLLTLSFPVKMLATLGGLALILDQAPRLFQQLAQQALGTVEEVIRGSRL